MDEFLSFVMSLNFQKHLFTEDNIAKCLKSFIYYADQMDENIIKKPYF